ncbi:MAG: hypothetical protein IOC97_08195 [Rhodobacter sp.]|nr:hypothetical protein [Rhodobacter sp.]
MAKSAADKAHDAAVKEIRRVKRAGETTLDLRDKRYRALDRIPQDIATLSSLKTLRLDRTAVSDLAPLAALTALQRLDLNQTAVSDLAPLAALTAVEGLGLNETAVSDLAPLAALTALRVLDLTHTAVSDLAPLATLTALQALWLDQTAVSDLAPLAALTTLGALTLNQTAVSDLAPLAGLTAMRTLTLNQTVVSDLAPLAALSELKHLALVGCQVADLRPIRGLAKLGTNGPPGLIFQDTPAIRADGTLARLAGITDSEDRARETLAYLNTLPPWPEPYTPSARPDGQPPQPVGQGVPEVPAPQPAPLQVVEVDGTLRPALPGDGLDDQARLLARQAWAALRDYLADLAPLRPRLDNQMPTLSRALDRFDVALGADYAVLNAIALGIHGSRITRVAAAASDSLSDADAAEIAAFAAAVALYLERFSAWRDYRRIDIPEVPSPASLAKALPRIDEIVADLFDRDAIAADIPEQLQMLGQSAKDAPDDALAVRGLFASFGNVMSALGHATLRVVKALGRGAVKQVGDLLEETRKLALKGVATSLLASAIDIFANKAAVLNALAAGFPEWFGWITPFLRMLGL